jgi:hypothetical protein
MQKRVSEYTKLLSRLPAYAASAGAMLGLSYLKADAQIIYSGNLDIELSLSNPYTEIDINGDETNDFGFHFDSRAGSFTYNSFYLKYTGIFAAIVNLRTDSYKNSWLTAQTTLRSSTSGGTVTYAYQVPAVDKLEDEEEITGDMTNWAYTSYAFFTGMLGVSYQYSIQGPGISFQSSDQGGAFIGDSGYIGVRFRIDTNQHYGWIRVQIDAEMESMILGWAWKSVAGEGLDAGEIPGGLAISSEGAVEKDIRIYPNPARDVLHFESEMVSDLQLIDLGGRILYERSGITHHSFDVSYYKPGLYILKVTNKAGSKEEKIAIR